MSIFGTLKSSPSSNFPYPNFTEKHNQDLPEPVNLRHEFSTFATHQNTFSRLVKQIALKLSWSIIIILFSAAPALAKLSLAEINSVARQTTVLIAPGLTKELVKELENNRNNPLNREGVWNPGSGVIIAREGSTYYVLTVAHNFSQRYLDAGIPFGIRTSDRQVHVVQQLNDGRGCPLEGQAVRTALLRFGCRLPKNEMHGIDLAIVRFTSDRLYPVATLGDSKTVQLGQTVYISGWPDPEKEAISDQFNENGTPKCRGRTVLRKRRLAWGQVTAKLTPTEKTLGYSIFYTDNTRAGMSGGPVFDENGQVVGSHGLGSNNKPQCVSKIQFQNNAEPENDLESGNEIEPENDLESTGDLESDSEPNVDGDSSQKISFAKLQKYYSSSQQIEFSLNLLSLTGEKLPFNLLPPSPEFIKVGLKPISDSLRESGKSDFDADSDGFDDPNDTEDNIYKLFSFGLQNQLRNEPSGGCGSILLGEKCER
jgi:serine protease Do